MRARFLSIGMIALIPLATACDGGGGAPCIVDTDCADFGQVCIAERCQPVGAQPEGGVPSDGGPRGDGGGMDGGPRDGGSPPDAAGDAATSDGAVDDAATDAPVSTCTDASGAYTVSGVLGPCGSAAAGNTATVTTTGADPCSFTIASNDVLTPAADGTFTLDASDSVASSSIDVGGAGAMSCTGSLSGSTLTFLCGTCTAQLTR